MIAAPRPLHAVPPPAAEPPVDIQAKARAEVLARDWSAVMVWGDKQKPVALSEPRRRGWLR